MNISGLFRCASTRAAVALRSYKKGRFHPARRLAAVRWAAWRSVEALEARTLLSSVSGTVYNDLNLSGSPANPDPGLAGVTVYDDLNNAGQYQSGDPSAVTASDGSYTLYHVPLNSAQIIRAAPASGWQQSTTGDGALSVTLVPGSAHATGIDFGQWQPIASLSAADVTLNEGQSFSGSVATITESAGAYANPSDYSGTLTLSGANALTFQIDGSGDVVAQPSNFPSLSAGSYSANVSVTESSNGQSATASTNFTLTVSTAPITAQGITFGANPNIAWSGTIATFTDPDPNAMPSNYTVSINYGDGSASSVGTVSADGSGGWLITGTHTFTGEGTYYPTVTINDPADQGKSASVGSTATVSFAPISVDAWGTASLQEGSTGNVGVGSVTDSAGVYATGNYSATFTVDGTSYSNLTFTSQGGGVYWIELPNFSAPSAGVYATSLEVSEGSQSATDTGTITVTDAPLTGTPANINALASVPFTGTVATFADPDPNAQASNYTATVNYADGSSPGTITSDGSGGWIVTSTLTFSTPGNSSPSVTITDNGGSTVTVNSSAAVTFAGLSLSAPNLYLKQGQSYDGNIGLLTDAAGSYSNAANFTGSITWDGWIYGALTLSYAGTGIWNVQAGNMSSLPAGSYAGSFSITETIGSQSITTDPVSFSINVIPPSLYAAGGYISATVEQPWSGTVAMIADDDAYDEPSSYYTAATNYNDGTGTDASQISATSNPGSWTVTDTHTFTASGTYYPATSVSDLNGAIVASATSYANVNLAQISLATGNAWLQEGQSLGGLVGTLTDSAGSYATGSYSGSLTLTPAGSYYGQSYSVTFVTDGNNDGVYNVEAAGLPELSAGTYSAALQASESANGQTVGASSSFAVSVADVPLTTAGDTPTMIAAVAGNSSLGTLFHFTDPDPNANPSTYSGTVNWGDGTSDSFNSGSGFSVNIIADPNGGFDVTGSHAYSANGSDGISVQVNDSGGSSLSGYLTAYVADAPITPASDTPTTIPSIEGQSAGGTLFHFVDGNSALSASSFAATVTWGDMTTTSTTPYGVTIVPDFYGGFDVTGYHTYSTAGTYGMSISVSDAAGTSVTGSPAAIIASAVPTNLTATAASADDINLSWTNNDPTANIEIDRSTSPSGPFIPLSPTLNSGVTTYSDGGLTADTTYYYEARALTAGFSSNASNIASDTTQSLTSSFVATPVNTGAIDLTWNLNVSNSGDADNIEVDRATSASGPFTAIAPSLSGNTIFYMDEDPVLTEATHYYYQLQVTESGGTSASTIADAWTAPAAPTDLAAQVGGPKEIDLSWTNQSANSDTVYVDRAPDGTDNYTTIATLGPGATDYPDTTAMDNTGYSYVVRASVAGVSSADSNAASATTPLAPPSGVQATGYNSYGSIYVSLGWTNESSNSPSFEIERQDPTTGDFPVVGNVSAGWTSGNDTDLIDGKTYTYEIVADEDGTLSAPSEPVSVTTPPDAPSALSATDNGATEIDLHWTNGATVSNGVQVWRSTDDQTFAPDGSPLAANTTTFHDTGLVSDTVYYYQVQALSGSATSQLSYYGTFAQTAAVAWDYAVPVSTGEIDLNWGLLVTSATSIAVDRSTDGQNFTSIATGLSPDTTTLPDTGSALVEGTQYYYRLDITEGSGSGAATVLTPATYAWTLPSAPTDLTASALAPTEVNLSWTNTSVGATGFQILRSNPDGTYTPFDTIYGSYPQNSTVTYSDQGAPDGTTSTYEVRTIGPGGLYDDASATSDPSNTVTTLPAAPSGLSVQAASASQIDLFWNNNSIGATGVEIERSTSGAAGSFTAIVTLAPSATSAMQYADIGLLAGTHYYYKLEAVTASAASTSVAADISTDADVDTLTVNPVSTTEIDLSWNLNTIGATAIEVDRNNGTGWTVVSNTLSGTQTSYNDTGLTENETYTYRVRAVEGASDSAYTEVATASTLAAISGLSATAGSTDGAAEIDLSWTLNLDPSTVTAIEVDRATSSSGPWTPITTTLDPSTSTYIDTDSSLNENTDYFYRVHAITVSGISEEVATTDATTAAAVDTLAATPASVSEIDLTWNLNVTDATAIEVDRSTDGGTTWATLTNSLSGTATSYNDTGLSDNTDYTYRVRAIRPSGDSAFTDSTGAQTVAAVSGLTATPLTTGEVDLAWTTNITSPTSIEIDRSTNGLNFTALSTPGLAATATSYHDTDVTEGVHYYYTVKVTGAGGPYNFSDPADAWTTPIQDLTATPNGISEIDLTWSNLSTNATAIEVDRSNDGGSTWTMLTNAVYGSATSFPDYGPLTANTHYTYRVRAIEPAGPAPFTSPLDAWTLPAVPSSLNVTRATPTEIDLSWTNNDSSSTPFYIERSDDGGVTFAIIDMTDPGATTYSDTTVTDGTSYVYQVDAVSGDGVEDNPDVTRAYTFAPLIAPTNPIATANGTGEIDLSWINTSQTATGYEIDRATDGLNFQEIGTATQTDDTFYSDTTATAGTQYYYRVLATGAGDSAPSPIRTAVTGPTVAISRDGASPVNPNSNFTLHTSVNIASGQADPITSWSITWGDGGSPQEVDGDPRTIPHSYAQAGTYTVTATAQTVDGTLDASGDVMDSNGNNLDEVTAVIAVPSPSLTIAVTQNGRDASIQPTLNLDGSTSNGAFIVDWGDGSALGYYADASSPFTHTYPADYPPVYAPTVTAVTSVGLVSAVAGVTFSDSAWAGSGYPGLWDISDNADGQSCIWGLDATYAVNVRAGNEPSDITNTNFEGIPNETYFLNWGDGSGPIAITTDSGGNASATHTYARTGTYLASLTASDSAAAQEAIPTHESMIVYAHGKGILLDSPADQIVGSGQSFTVSANYTYDPDGAASDIVAWVDLGDGTGPHQATVTPGSGGGTVSLTFDHAPAPGTYANATVLMADAAHSGYLYDGWGGGPLYVSARFTLYVWGVTIGDGTNNDLLMASDDGTQNLQPVTVYFPHPAGEALNLTLTTTDGTEDNLWPSLAYYYGADTTGTPLLGGPNNTQSYVFSVGPYDSTSKTFWVGATAGSTIYDVLRYSISGQANDANSTSVFVQQEAAGAFSSTGVDAPVLSEGDDGGDGGSGGETADFGDCQNGANDFKEVLKLNSDPNNNNPANGPYNWLVGQIASLTATATGPAPLIANVKFSWDVPGTILWKYTQSQKSATIGGVARTANVQAMNGKAVTTLDFFWVATQYDPQAVAGVDHDAVSVTAESVGNAKITDVATLNFNLYSPAVTFPTPAPNTVPGITPGAARIGKIPGKDALGNNIHNIVMGLFGAPGGADAGMVWQVGVSTQQPQGVNAFGAGYFNVVQLIKPGGWYDIGAARVNARSFGKTQLDNDVPYPIAPDAPSPYDKLPNDKNQNTAWQTDTPVKTFADTPFSKIGTAANGNARDYTVAQPNFATISRDDEFHTYVMYLPPGNNSSWVPLLVEQWSFSISAAWNGQTKMYDLLNPPPPPPKAPPFQRTTDEPVWADVTVNNKYF